MPTVTITGGTGLVGTALRQALVKKGYRVIILSRAHEKKMDTAVSYATWDISKHFIENFAISETDHIIHLAGTSIAGKRWTKKRKQEIVDSRVNGSNLLAEYIKKTPNKIKTVVTASAIGWYGEDPAVANPAPFKENAAPATDFLGQTCKKWEGAIEPVAALGKRVVKIRTGIVLSKDGGALQEFIKPIKWGVAAVLGNGKQMISWIDIDDLVAIYIAAIENEKMSGPYNAVSPNPVTNKQLTIQLARERKKIFIPLHVPSFLVRLVLGEMSKEVLKSSTVSAEKIANTGFVFKYPLLEQTLRKEA